MLYCGRKRIWQILALSRVYLVLGTAAVASLGMPFDSNGTDADTDARLASPRPAPLLSRY